MPLVSAPSLTQTAGGQNLYAVAGSTGPGGGVTQLLAGANVTLSPSDGLGVVTVSASGGGGGGGVTSVTAAGAGISATPTTGAVVISNTGVTSVSPSGAGIAVFPTFGAVAVQNTGVTSLVAGPGIVVSGASGAVTVTNGASVGVTTTLASLPQGGGALNAGTNGVVEIELQPQGSVFGRTDFTASVTGPGFSVNDIPVVILKRRYLGSVGNPNPTEVFAQPLLCGWNGSTGFSISMSVQRVYQVGDQLPAVTFIRFPGVAQA